MIAGILPVGGKGKRLGLPFSKEMLPQKGYDYYNPVSNHIVRKMILAGASKIVFVHGDTFKLDIKEYFSGPLFTHVLQQTPGFANTIKDGVEEVRSSKKILFGLPDSIFLGNPFLPMLLEPGIVCGLFTTDDETRVDRLNGTNFDVKEIKTEQNSNQFWGVLKFEAENIKQFINDQMFDKHNEIGTILNHYNKTMVDAGPYIDIGTWRSYNNYLKDWL